MTTTMQNPKRSGWTKNIIGAVILVAFTLSFGWVVRNGFLPHPSMLELAAIITCFFYLFLGGMSFVGFISPNAGSQFLNVEDADELREMRKLAGYASTRLLLLGLALGVMIPSGPGGALAANAQAVIAAVLVVGFVLLGVLQWRHMDEMMRAATHHGAAWAYYLTVLVGGGAALLAQTGYMPMPPPIAWLTILWATYLVGGIIAAGGRGMLARH